MDVIKITYFCSLKNTIKKVEKPHYQSNANQNLNEVLLHASQNGCLPKRLQTINAGEDVKKGESSTLMVGMQTGTATMENSVEIP